MHKITLLTKPGCERCAQAKESINRLIGAHATVWIEEVNILDDPELLAKYKDELPVVFIDGTERFRKTLDPQKLAGLLSDEFGVKLVGF